MFTQRKRDSRSVRERGREVEELFTFGQLGSTCQASRNLISLVQPKLAYFCLAASHRYTYILNKYICMFVASVAATSFFLGCRGNHPSCGFYFCLSHHEYENLIFMPLHQMRHQHLIFLQWLRTALWARWWGSIVSAFDIVFPQNPRKKHMIYI